MPDVFTEGVYSLQDARQILQIDLGRFWSWFVPRNNQRHWLQTPSYKPVGRAKALTFLDLVEAWVANQLIVQGKADARRVLALHRRMEQEHGPHPFSRKAILGDAIAVVEERLGTSGQRIYRESSKQLIAPQLALQIMLRIDWGADGFASRLRPMDGILLDPLVSLGQPVTEANKLSTSILYDAWVAHNHHTKEVAEWYEIAPEEVETAVRYEEKKRAA